MAKINELVKVLTGHEVYIQTHNFPDPDAIASAFAMHELLGYFGIEASIVYDGNLDKISGIRMIDYFNIDMHSYKEISNMNEDAYIILIDAQKYNKNCTDLPGVEIACIDHHPIINKCDEYEFVDIRYVGACASIIAEYYFEADIAPSIDVATALLYGIKMDTYDFGRGVDELDVEMYYKLFPFTDKHLIEKMQLNNIEFKDLRAYGVAIENISVYKNIGFAVLPFDCPDGLIAIISDFILALDVVEFSVVYSIRPSGYKFSVRSEVEYADSGKVINEVLSAYGGSGGGHSFMAGGFLPEEKVKELGDNPRLKIEEDVIKQIYPNDDVKESDFIRNNI